MPRRFAQVLQLAEQLEDLAGREHAQHVQANRVHLLQEGKRLVEYLRDKVEDRIDRLLERICGLVDCVNRRVDLAIDPLAGALGLFGEGNERDADQALDELAKALDQADDDRPRGLDDAVDDCLGGVDDALDQFAQAVEDRVDRVLDGVEDAGDRALDAVPPAPRLVFLFALLGLGLRLRFGPFLVGLLLGIGQLLIGILLRG